MPSKEDYNIILDEMKQLEEKYQMPTGEVIYYYTKGISDLVKVHKTDFDEWVNLYFKFKKMNMEVH
jgi:hypothetical protein